MAEIQLMIADDHLIFREGLKSLIKSETNIHIIAEAENGTECLKKLEHLTPDLLILDICMPEKSGIEVLSELNKKEKRNMKILVLTASKDMVYYSKAYHLGIDGYLLKDTGFEELKKAIYMILSGEVYISPEISASFEKVSNEIEENNKKIKTLTKRELEVLKNLTHGMYNKEIAIKLGISERTVKNHVSNIFKKISVADRTQAALFAVRNHIVFL